MARPGYILIMMIIFYTGQTAGECRKYAEQVLLVSMDGFRYDYPEKTATPNFDRMALNGVRAKYMNSTFVTKSFPTHYSLVTGMYSESHGFVGNKMFDPDFGGFFSIQSNETKWWDAGEPLWITARKRGLTSSTVFWPGSDVPIQKMHPDKWYKFNTKE